jgi:hypothetical protein
MSKSKNDSNELVLGRAAQAGPLNTNIQISEEDDAPRGRAKRKTTYRRVIATQIPDDVKEAFLKDDWGLRFVRFSIHGQVDEKNLSARLQNGYEFVTVDDLKKKGVEWYLQNFRMENTRQHSGVLVSGDTVLMKADVNLQASRTAMYQEISKRELDSADMAVVAKKKGFKDFGSRSHSTTSEPKFQN